MGLLYNICLVVCFTRLLSTSLSRVNHGILLYHSLESKLDGAVKGGLVLLLNAATQNIRMLCPEVLNFEVELQARD